MTITPAEISLGLIGAIALAVAAVMGWGLRTTKARKAAVAKAKPDKTSSKHPARPKSDKHPPAKAAPRPAPAGKGPAPSALERKYAHAGKVFTRAIDKRIKREPLVGEDLRRHRELVIDWYRQAGRVQKVRFQAKDPRTACKVCHGRNSKEYDLLKAEVVAQILPPCHPADKDRQQCWCSISAVLAPEPATR